MDPILTIARTEQCSGQALQGHFAGSHRQRQCRHSSGLPTDRLVEEREREREVFRYLSPTIHHSGIVISAALRCVDALTFVISHSIASVVVREEVHFQHLAKEFAPGVNATEVFCVSVRIKDSYPLLRP